jgi:glycogen synthase
MLAASDMALFLTEPADHAELAHCLSYGTVPVSVASQSLKNYDPNQEQGNAFLFEKTTVWQAFAAVVRALETFRFPFDWRTIQRHGMEQYEQK